MSYFSQNRSFSNSDQQINFFKSLRPSESFFNRQASFSAESNGAAVVFFNDWPEEDVQSSFVIYYVSILVICLLILAGWHSIPLDYCFFFFKSH